jgi:hypothetical protein
VAPPAPIQYDLVDLFADQPEWFARETVPHLLAWLREPKAAATFKLVGDGATEMRLELRWSAAALAARLPGLEEEVGRLAGGESVRLEQTPQYGAYALAGVVAATVLRRRVVALRSWLPPDLLFDTAPGALRGIEVAGRSSKGLSGLRALAVSKSADLIRSPDVAEGWLSLWCTIPRVSMLLKVMA